MMVARLQNSGLSMDLEESKSRNSKEEKLMDPISG
jgi:hypothetical protein